MILLDKITIKPVKSLPFSPHYGKLPYFSLNYHILYFQMYFNISLSFKNIRTIYQKRVTFCNFWNRSSHRNDCFLFLELFSIIYQAHNVRSSVQNVFFCTYLFQKSLISIAHFIIWYLICLFSIFISSSVIFVDIRTDILTTFLMLDIHKSRQYHS